MSTPSIPSVTPNVVVANPAVRKGVGVVLGIAALILPIAGILDQYVAGDWSPVLLPAGAIALFLSGAFGLGVTIPNIPSPGANVAVEVVKEPVTVVGDEPEYHTHV
jgi:hypothetical protein